MFSETKGGTKMENIWNEILSWEWEYMLRLVIACLCGACVGFERSRRFKDAGVRTHVMVTLGAALIMIVSKYGFQDIPALEMMKVDASRVASNVVTGVGFLGAGVIFFKGTSIKGLTTAAGIWTTAGIGLALGSGMYFVGIMSAVIMIIAQFFLHRVLKSVDSYSTSEISVSLQNEDGVIDDFKKQLEKENLVIQACKIIKNSEEGTITLKATVRMPHDMEFEDVVRIVENNKRIKSIEF
ncbi:MAG: MgtC/SapB family protein [Ruminococcaceae bacterium]|nr:MgtC/SapB family protein [Oscillospiraceae bacterium]